MTKAIASFYEKYKSKPEIDHVIDFLKDQYAHKNSINFNYDQALQKANQWTEEINEKNKKNLNIGKIRTIMEFEDGYRIVLLEDAVSKQYEGVEMGHCVGSQIYKAHEGIYSLRDAQNKPHATIEASGSMIVQIKGKANLPILPKYIAKVIAFLKKTGFYFDDPSRVFKEMGLIEISKEIATILEDAKISILYFQDKNWLSLKDRVKINQRIIPIWLKMKKNNMKDLDRLALLFDSPFLMRRSSDLGSVFEKFNAFLLTDFRSLEIISYILKNHKLFEKYKKEDFDVFLVELLSYGGHSDLNIVDVIGKHLDLSNYWKLFTKVESFSVFFDNFYNYLNPKEKEEAFDWVLNCADSHLMVYIPLVEIHKMWKEQFKNQRRENLRIWLKDYLTQGMFVLKNLMDSPNPELEAIYWELIQFTFKSKSKLFKDALAEKDLFLLETFLDKRSGF